MSDFTPNPEFEKKVQAAASAPSARSEFVNQLRAQIATAKAAPPRRRYPFSHLFQAQGNPIMRTRVMFPALVAVIALAVVAFFTLNSATKVSAQQILDRATAAQSDAASATAKGILHTRIQIEKNYQPFGSDQPATRQVYDDYMDVVTGSYRSVTEDAAGKITDAFGKDSAYTYSVERGGSTITRAPLNQDEQRKAAAGDGSLPDVKALFDQFRSNPRVELESTITWTDGSQAYVLVDRSYQTQKGLDGQTEKTYTGSMKMIFNAQTYALLATETSIRQDGKDVVIDASRWLVNEVLPAGSPVAWDLSDLPGMTRVDAAPADASTDTADPVFETLSEHQLAERAKAYVLKTVPAGFELKIGAVTNQPKDQPYAYEVNYSGPSGETFWMQCIGATDPAFIASNFYDGSYKAANGMSLHYSISSSDGSGVAGTNPQPGKTRTNAILTTPDGTDYLLTSSFTREQVQAMVEDLTPAK